MIYTRPSAFVHSRSGCIYTSDILPHMAAVCQSNMLEHAQIFWQTLHSAAFFAVPPPKRTFPGSGGIQGINSSPLAHPSKNDIAGKIVATSPAFLKLQSFYPQCCEITLAARPAACYPKGREKKRRTAPHPGR
ncbi:hypothetical protein D3Z48_02880 [Clostridiaceae bacterium]|nr:hypothetical protein [Clostridiaceae bacterium]